MVSTFSMRLIVDSVNMTPRSATLEPMTTSTYHHGDLREALVDAAVAAVREDGPDSLRIRDLARRVGVSHNAAYRHFADRDGLIAEVSERVMHRLLQQMQTRLSAVSTEDPVLRARQRLAETGRAYVDFALSEPGLFRLAFSSLVVVGETLPPTDRDPYALLGHVLDDLVDVGFLAVDARPSAEITCWASVHGFSVLCIDGALRGAGEADRAAALEQMLTSIDRSYAATTGAQTAPGDLRV